MKTYKCKVCGAEFQVEDGVEPVCPICNARGDKLELVEDAPKHNKYAGTQTEKNLEAAFAGESQARNKYTYFSSVAKKEGYEQIAALFLKTAENEKEHAKLWFKELNGIGDTAENLLSAAEGENYEWTDMYDGFAKTADEETGRLTVTDYKRQRLTGGITFSLSKAFRTDLRLNYEKYFYAKNSIAKESEQDKVVLELMVRF